MIFIPEILIHDTIPPELAHIAPREMNKQSWWNKERKLAEAVSEGKCFSCGIHKSKQRYKVHLEGHEICTVNHERHTLTLEQVVVLCNSCHSFIHVGAMIRKFNDGVISYGYLTNTLKHGINILKDEELKPTATQAIHWLMMVKEYTQQDAIAYVVNSKLYKSRLDIDMEIEWKLQMN